MSSFPPELIAAYHGLPSMTAAIMRRLLEAKNYRSGFTFSDWPSCGADAQRSQKLMTEFSRLDLSGIKTILEEKCITVLSHGQSTYPYLLSEIPSPPPVLYIRGKIKILNSSALAVVGTRRPTAYGLAVTESLTETAARAGITIVSGLAYGIDARAHAVALRVGTPTIAVLGSGIEQIYPPEHRQLAQNIVDHGGAVISEFPLGAAPERYHFPQRNRIISGLSKAVLLVEAGYKSGALITAKFAVDQNREVLAVPGPITSAQSIGPNNWLRLGAKIAARPEDILEVFSLQQSSLRPAARATSNDPTEASILEILQSEQLHIDEIVRKSRLDTSVVTATLSILEIRGLVQHLGGMIYTLSVSSR